ncbi:MAG: transposase [Rhodospirillales bacterium]|nr:transposase [Rhodospirillales bacterium]
MIAIGHPITPRLRDPHDACPDTNRKPDLVSAELPWTGTLAPPRRRVRVTHEAPGKSFRDGFSLMQLIDMFPDEESARKWFEGIIWPTGRYCPKCGSTNTHEAKHAKCPYRCRDCKKYFSVKK